MDKTVMHFKRRTSLGHREPRPKLRTRGFQPLAVVTLTILAGWISPAHAIQPIPPLMKTLLEVFPEQNGWFVEGPVGVMPGIPGEVRQFFECPRVIVPEYQKVDLAAGNVLAAEAKLSARKIIRFDRKPGVANLPGLRGVWCTAEDKPDAGFLLLTPNENRYLIWARHCYYPAFAVDSIQGKVRDAYARAVADHLTAIDYGVPATVPPRASERNLPAWMDLFPDTAGVSSQLRARFDSLLVAAAEMKLWGCTGFTEVVVTQAAIDHFITAATDSLYENLNPPALQYEYHNYLKSNSKKAPVVALSKGGFDTLALGWYIFAVDEYGRVRIARTADPNAAKPLTGQTTKNAVLTNQALLFPDQPLLAAGQFEVVLHNSHRAVRSATIWSDHFFFSPLFASVRQDITDRSDACLTTLGHLFARLRDMGVPLDGLRIHKF